MRKVHGKHLICFVLLSLLLSLFGCAKQETTSETTPTPVIYENAGDPTIFKGEEWYDLVETVQVNREKAHTFFIPYTDEATALANEQSAFTKEKDQSDLMMSLNGTWKFAYVDNPFYRYGDTWYEQWDTSDWDDIEVPSNVELQIDEEGNFKYSKPIYINQIYPWVNYEDIHISEYPTAPTVVNPVYHYKKTFTLDEYMDDKQIFVNFEGVSSAFYLYVNGNRVGYSEDSWDHSEFNITSYLNKNADGGLSNTENTIALQVYRWSLGSYLENQDMIRLSGIFRDVDLIAKDDVEIFDYDIKQDLSDDYRSGDVDVSVVLKSLNLDTDKNYSVDIALYPNDSEKVIYQESLSYTMGKTSEEIINDEGVQNSLSFKVNSPDLWFPDSPNLYRLLITLKDSEGEIVEVACQRFGFRKLTITELDNGHQQMSINGLPLTIKGVNRHEYNLLNGTALTKDNIVEDLLTIKQNNFNAIRTSHYPNQTITYDLADELGIMICAEANIESHYAAQYDNLPSGYPAWNNSVMDRTVSMYQRDKNHTSIIMWGLANEATYEHDKQTLDELYPLGATYCFELTSQYLKSNDPSRFIVYERDNREGIVDVYSSQYYSLDQIKDNLKNSKMPFILSEYSHSMGNGDGNLNDYWQLIRSEPQAQGGFIWDYKDQSILMSNNGVASQEDDITNLSADAYFSYGGDWGDTNNDLDFCGDGLLYADGSMSSKMIEANKVLQNINFEQVDNENYLVTNEFYSLPLSNFSIAYQIQVDGNSVQEGDLSLNCAPLTTEEFKITLNDDIEVYDNSSVYINFVVKLKDNTNYGMKKNDEIAHEQFPLALEINAHEPKQSVDKLTLNDNDSNVEVSNENLKVVVDKTSGLITTYQVNGKDVLLQAPQLNYMRAPISNDMSYSFIDNAQSSYAQSLADTQTKFVITSKDIKVTNNDNEVMIVIPGYLEEAGHSYNEITYIIYGNGHISVNNVFKPSTSIDGVIPKIGMQMELAGQYDQVTYYGAGPYANYIDRNSASSIGLYKTSVSEMFESKFLRPQENGNRTKCDLVALTNNDGLGVAIIGDGFEFTASNYSYQELQTATHAYELKPSNNVILNINLVQRGLGNAVCGPLPLDQYVIQKGQTYSYGYTIVPLTNKLDETTINKLLH